MNTNDLFTKQGVEEQMNANSFEDAKERYMKMCLYCVMNGENINCSKCKIRAAFLLNGMIFRKKLTRKDKEFIQQERGLQ